MPKYARAVVSFEVEGVPVYRAELALPVPGAPLPDVVLDALARQTFLKAVPSFRVLDREALRRAIESAPDARKSP